MYFRIAFSTVGASVPWASRHSGPEQRPALSFRFFTFFSVGRRVGDVLSSSNLLCQNRSCSAETGEGSYLGLVCRDTDAGLLAFLAFAQYTFGVAAGKLHKTEESP